MSTPRGIANNNPGNIVKTSTVWKGEKLISSDPVFEQFETIELGYRALIKLLIGPAYISAPTSLVYTRVWEGAKGEKIQGPLNTIYKIFSKYCDDQTTADYIKTVEKKVAISRFTEINPNDRATMKRLVMAISYVENGINAVEKDVDAAFDILDVEKKSPLSAAQLVEDLTSNGPGMGIGIVVAALLFLFLIFND
jgi:hypothetical protein